MSIRIRFLLATMAVIACKPKVMLTPPPATASAEQVALSGASVLIGTGDIASCSSQGDEQTAAIVDSIIRADSVAKVETAVFTTGDNAYPSGSMEDYINCFKPSWGDSTKRIMKVIHPSPGNHEHLTSGAAPYYNYFGKAAGDSKKGYYSFNLGEWHIVMLNSEMVVNTLFPDTDRLEQNTWLLADLKANTKKCTVAIFHHPRFSSGWHGSDPHLAGIWAALYDVGADLILNGHDHHYERFKPMNPAGQVDTLKGMTEIVIGTGGGELRGLRNPIVPNSAYTVQGHFGVLKLTLGKEEWRSAFITTSGAVYDSSGGRCH